MNAELHILFITPYFLYTYIFSSDYIELNYFAVQLFISSVYYHNTIFITIYINILYIQLITELHIPLITPYLLHIYIFI